MADSGNFTVLNLGSQRISAGVFAKTRSGELLLKRYDFAEMHGDPTVEATRLPQLHVAITELADKLKLKGSKVWYSIAGHVVFTRFVKLPPFEDEKADQIVEFEARQNVPFPINEVIWDYEFIEGGASGEREVALVAIRAEGLNDINEQVESVGLQVDGVDLAPLAVFNAFRYCYPDVDESTLLIDLGARSTNLLFVEGGKVFTRNILVGGSTITGVIAKELGGNFSEAEAQKRSKGYVAPGGAYEPNEDETIDAIAKIMRNTMTRLHGEVVRTINYYRTQQGGSPPRRIFLCGGGAQTPLAIDFFQEKFNLPVESFNALRGVQLDKKVNQAQVQSHAGSLGELVGLALRQIGSCPMEVELVPDAVELRRDSAKRAPLLVMATLCLFAALGVGIFYFKRAEAAVQEKLATLKMDRDGYDKFTKQIKEVDKRLEALRGQSSQLEHAVTDRGYWDSLLATLNNKFETDFLWLTSIEVTQAGRSISPSPGSGFSGGKLNAPAAPINTAHPVASGNQRGPIIPAAPPPFELKVQGLYRKNEAGGPDVVYKYFNDLKALTKLFPANDQKVDATIGLEDDRYAYQFKFQLPLVPGMNFEK